ncbi:hypothetical protein ACK3BE_33430 (plasmid) [Pseudomonas mandelii]|uniref:hypothetical protein n=1 Tax=Pseudomonas mandelii TaxID=75612 RepID=UPI00398CC6F1
MSKIGTTWFPFFKGKSVEENLEGAVNRVNEIVAENDLQVINIETVYRTNWLGRAIEPCGLRVWWRGEPTLTAKEAVQSLFDQVNS